VLKLAYRNIKVHKVRTILTALGVVLGVALMLAVGILNQSMLKTFEQINMRAGGNTDIVVTKYNSFSAKDIEYINSIEEVITAVPMTIDNTKVENMKKENLDALILGIDISRERQIRNYELMSGEWFSDRKAREIIINEKTSKELGKDVNDLLSIPTRTGIKDYRIVGIIENRGAGLPSNDIEMYAPIDAVSYDFRRNGIFTRMDLDIDHDAFIVSVAESIKNKFGDDVDTLTLTENLSMAKRNMAAMKTGFYAILAAVIFVGCFLVYNTFSVIVLERTQMIGILRSIGMNKKQTIKMILVEGVLLGFIGTVIGLVLGFFVASGLLNLMSSSIKIEFNQYVFSLKNVVMASVVGLTIPIASCLIPAFKAGKYSPIQAIKVVDSMQYTKKGKTGFFRKYRTKLGVILILIFFINFEIVARCFKNDLIYYIVLPITLPIVFMGIFFITPFLLEKTVNFIDVLSRIAFGKRTVLSTRNLLRNKSRTSITVSIITIGVVMSVGFKGMFYSVRESAAVEVDRSLKGDLVINTWWDLSYPEHAKKYKELKKLSGIEDVGYSREEWFEDERGRWQRILGIHPDEHARLSYFDIKEGNREEIYSKMASGERIAVVGQYYWDELGLNIGDSITVSGARKEYTFNIGGFVNDKQSNVVYIHRDMLDEMYGGKYGNSFIIKTEYGVDIDSLKNIVKSEIVKDESAEVATTYQLRETIKKEIITGTEPFDVINIITIVVALFGLMNTLLMSIIERKREVGMLRSIGASKKHIQRMIFGESLIMGIFSIVTGVFFGIVLSREANLLIGIIMNVGNVDFYIPYDFILMSTLAVLVCAIIAAFYPSRIALKTKIIDAIKGE